MNFLAPVRFLWNATRGHHLRPWRSEYIRWRIETYSGRHADQIGRRSFFRFLVKERFQLPAFLVWVGRISSRRPAGPV